MTAEKFFEKFDLLADAPDAIDKMRELVLQLAVAGSLTRDQADEPDDVPMVRLSELEPKFQNGAASRGDKGGTPTIVLRLADILDQRISVESPRTIPIAQGDIAKYALRAGDTLVTRVNGSADIVGTFIPVEGDLDAIYCDHFIRMRLDLDRVDPAFVAIVGRTRGVRDQIKSLFVSTAGQKTVNQGHISSLTIPLPPLAEQKRIVAKVDELMALCDRLEAQQKEREAKHAVLARAALARFAEAPTPANLDYLFHSAFEINSDELRTALLILAVDGRLLSENERPQDELADEALMLDDASTDELRPLPSGWIWSQVKLTGRVDLGRQRAPQHHVGPNMRPYLRVQNVYEARLDLSDVKAMNFSPQEFKTFELLSGDILLNEGQSFKLVGRPAIYRGEVPGACFQNTLVRYRPGKAVVAEYALLVFRAYMRNGRFQSVAKQTTNIAHLSAGRFATLEFPLPPLAEQRRIVAKLDALMALVDRLEAQLAESWATAGRLIEAVVAVLTAAGTISDVSTLRDMPE